jgi:hypothetical protein
MQRQKFSDSNHFYNFRLTKLSSIISGSQNYPCHKPVLIVLVQISDLVIQLGKIAVTL